MDETLGRRSVDGEPEVVAWAGVFAERVTAVTKGDVENQLAYVAQQRLDGYDVAVGRALRRKVAFDKRVRARWPKEVVFEPGDLVLVRRSDLDYTFKTERKLRLETREGEELSGWYSARRLERFEAREGTELYEEQKEAKRKYMENDEKRKADEKARIEKERENEAGTSSGDSDTSDDETSSGGSDTSGVGRGECG